MGRPLRILLADDDVRACDELKRGLAGLDGIDLVSAVYDGFSALDGIFEYMPDVALLDVVMPRLDAIGVMEKIQVMGLVRMPRVVLMAAPGQEEIAQRGMDKGADVAMIRPVNGDKLLETVTRLAGSSGELQDAPRVSPPGCANDRRIVQLMNELRIPEHLMGYSYLRDAISMVLLDIDILGAVTKVLYPAIAARHNSTPERVERSIRHAIEATWNRGHLPTIVALFGNTVSRESGKPTNAAFIARMADVVRLQ